MADLCGARLAQGVDAFDLTQPGVAHGFGGVALALARLAATGTPAAGWDAARRAWEREALVRSDGPGFIPGLTRHGHGWCRGTAGMGLVALEIQRESGAGEPVELAVSLASTGTAPAVDLDGLCCGAAGELDLLLAATGRLPGRPGVAERLATYQSAWVRRLRAQGPALDLDRLGRRRSRTGLFRGLAGVAYQLLRCSRPELWPSILMFQLPGEGTGGSVQ